MIRRLAAAVVVSLTLGAAASTLLHAQTVVISGTVLDSVGAILPGITVRATSADGRQFVATTDSQGRFAIPVEPGEYVVSATAEGFATVQRRVTAAPGQTASLVFRIGAAGAYGPQPPGTPSAPTSSPPRSAAAPPPSHANVTVFFATDRNKGTTTPLPYGSVRQNDGTLHLGQVDVHVPRDHHIGVIERPNIWTLWREDPNKTFMVTRFTEQASTEFFSDLRAFVGRSQGKQAFVFVHGFNVSFGDAVFRTAQLAYDLSFDGAPILYSWPAKEGLASYAADLNNNDWTVVHLRSFLEQVAAQSGAQTIHLIAHSMGNRALVSALSQMAANPPARRPHFNQLALTAPDIDAQVFKQLAGQFQPLVSHATLYASSKDEALTASKAVQGGYQRAGDTEPTVVVIPGIDTIDVSNVDSNLIGHFYYGDNRSVISDLRSLLDGLLPARRATLESVTSPAGEMYWRFRP